MGARDALTLKEVFPWGRTFDEYERMFSLDDDDLRGRILGVGDGPASFNAEASARGCRVVSVDPIYAFSAEQIRNRIDETADDIVRRTTDHPERFVWDRITSAEHLRQVRMGAMERFLADFADGLTQGRYVTGGLPELPGVFADRRFDLAVCSHFLFLYTDDAGDAFHIAAMRELLRVAKQVRVFPVHNGEGGESPHLPGVMAAMRSDGADTELRTVPYEFLRGATQMLVLSKA